MPRHNETRLHTHDFSELVIITGGSAVHFTGQSEHTVMAGNIFVLKGADEHGYRETRNLELINIIFKNDRLGIPLWDIAGLQGYQALFRVEPGYRRYYSGESGLRLSVDEMRNLLVLVQNLEKELDSPPENGAWYSACAVFMQIIIFLSRHYGMNKKLQNAKVCRISDLLGYMEKNYAEKISLDSLVRRSFCSLSTLRRIFIEVTGYAPIDYLLHLRIQKAGLLLRQNIPVSAAAFACGFDDSNYFSRQFKKITGCSPREYRLRIL